MPWEIKPHPARIFERNPLQVVVAQVRFHPILRVAQTVVDFQERVRHSFPTYQQQQVQTVEPKGPAGFQVKLEPQFVFSDPRALATLYLSNTSLTLESRQHRDRAAFHARMASALDAFLTVHGGFQGTRLGLRYINILRTQVIGTDLGRLVTLDGLVSAPYCHPPGSVTRDGDTRFAGEVVSGVRDQGSLALRYAWREPAAGQPAEYHLDFDRYFEGDFQPAQVGGLLEDFAQDIFATYMDAAGDDLLAWMGVGREKAP